MYPATEGVLHLMSLSRSLSDSSILQKMLCSF